MQSVSQSHRHCFEHVQLQVVLTALDRPLFNFPSISKLIALLDVADDSGVTANFGSFRTEGSVEVQSLM